jgi:cytochrome c-type protein NapC
VNRLAEIWGRLWSPLARFSAGTLVVGGAIAGILFWGGFNWAIELSNSEGFCISCHEMRATVYEELRETIHFSNRTGVRATCPDCHVPKNWFLKMERKIQASFNELPKHILGAMDTPAKFEEQRYELALRVWTRMKQNDSLECRNCHDWQSMTPKKQTEKAWDRHEKGRRDGMTCIDCHFGIAHKEPEGEKGPRDIVVTKR